MAEWSTSWSHGGQLQLIDTSQTGDWLAVTASGSTNTKGSYAVASSSTPVASTGGILVSFTGVTANADTLFDIAVGANGAEQVIAENLLWDAALRCTIWMYLPINVPASSRVAARCQSTTASHSCRVGIHLINQGPWAMPMVGSKVVALGAATADSGGTALDAGGTANTFGSWAALSTSTPNDIIAYRVLCGLGTNTVPASCGFGLQLGIGGAGSEVVMSGPIKFPCAGTGDVVGPTNPFWIPCQIPAGQRLSGRVMSSTTDVTDRIIDVVVYGLVA